MVNYNRRLDATFGALADPTRRAILMALMRGQSSVSELARPHRMSLPAVMKHLGVLQRAGLVSQKKIGRSRRCRLVARPLKNAEAWIAQYRAFWEKQLDSLDRYLMESNQTGVTEWPRNK
ncbi:MAG: metalloregulator ArsR/SmtB family transcription factor [Acidobacteriia bacterium]|nr:metalloregulator ArsR/SmtB family transcription factor [Terriglobia bacterium]